METFKYKIYRIKVKYQFKQLNNKVLKDRVNKLEVVVNKLWLNK